MLSCRKTSICAVRSVSAGAMNGLNYVSGQMGRSIRMNLKYRHDKRYVGRKALQNREGLIGFAFAFPQADQEYAFDKKRFFQFDRRFYCCCDQL